MHGQGIYYFTKGDVYEGEFQDNKRHGQGMTTSTITSTNKNIRVTNTTSNTIANINTTTNTISLILIPTLSKFSLTRILLWANSIIIELFIIIINPNLSTFYLLILPYLGILRYADGRVYEGLWREDQKHGMGEQRWTHGHVYSGMWSRDVREGSGTMSYPDGSTYKGGWMCHMLLPHIPNTLPLPPPPPIINTLLPSSPPTHSSLIQHPVLYNNTLPIYQGSGVRVSEVVVALCDGRTVRNMWVIGPGTKNTVKECAPTLMGRLLSPRYLTPQPQPSLPLPHTVHFHYLVGIHESLSSRSLTTHSHSILLLSRYTLGLMTTSRTHSPHSPAHISFVTLSRTLIHSLTIPLTILLSWY